MNRGYWVESNTLFLYVNDRGHKPDDLDLAPCFSSGINFYRKNRWFWYS